MRSMSSTHLLHGSVHEYLNKGGDTSSVSFQIMEAQLKMFEAKCTHGMRWKDSPELLQRCA